MKTIVLKVSRAGVAWNAETGLPWSATNLPDGAFDHGFRTFYWEVELLAYAAAPASLDVRVNDYDAEEMDFDPERKPSAPIRHLRFAPLDGPAFKAQLVSYRAGNLLPVLAPPTATSTDDEDLPPELATAFAELTPGSSPSPSHPPPGPSVPRTVKFKIHHKDLKIVDGGVTGNYLLPPADTEVPFFVPNPHLLKEFHPIRSFLLHQHRPGPVPIRAELSFDQRGEPRLTNARSERLARIDDRHIQILRVVCFRALARHTSNIDKYLFSPDELFRTFHPTSPKSALLPKDSRELLAGLLENNEVRNARHLRYLAADCQDPTRPLRFVLEPQFGLVFTVPTDHAHHYVLELLDSHATYVWSFPAEAGMTRTDRQLGEEIATLAALGRQAYRRTQQLGDAFAAIPHESAGSAFVDGFARWKAKLDSRLA